MRGSRIRTVAIAALAVLLSLGVAQAAPITFFGDDAGPTHPNSDAAQTSFFSNLSSHGTDTLESLTNGGTAPQSLSFAPVTTGSLSGSGSVLSIPSPPNSNGGFPISATQVWHLENASGFTITLGASVTGFGFYAVDVGEGGNQLSVSLGGGTPISIVQTQRGDGNVFFFGAIDTAGFTTIAFQNLVAGDAMEFDNFTAGIASTELAATPEPASMLLLGSALLTAGGAACRRRRRQPAAE